MPSVEQQEVLSLAGDITGRVEMRNMAEFGDASQIDMTVLGEALQSSRASVEALRALPSDVLAELDIDPDDLQAAVDGSEEWGIEAADADNPLVIKQGLELDRVDNTRDYEKPISRAVQQVLDNLAGKFGKIETDVAYIQLVPNSKTFQYVDNERFPYEQNVRITAQLHGIVPPYDRVTWTTDRAVNYSVENNVFIMDIEDFEGLNELKITGFR